VATVLVQHGHLEKGDFVVVGRGFGRVRDIINDRGQRVDEAVPSTPVAISGIGEVPDAGDSFYVVKTLKEAEAAAEERSQRDREQGLVKAKPTLDKIFEQFQAGAAKELLLVVKADVQGSVDAVVGALEKLSTDDVTIAIQHSAVGGINESDVILANAANAIIVGFNVTAAAPARHEAESRGTDIRLYDVIYDVIDDVTKAAEGLLEPEHRLEVLGHAEVREVFKISKVGMIAGCYVTDGVIERNAQVRVTRQEIVVEKDRRLQQLKRFKEDVKEVRSGQECGMKIDGYDDIKVGDVLECYRTLEVKRTLA
jgi:translation initiation factor IF-2